MAIQFLSFDIDDTLLPSHHTTDDFYQFWKRLEFKSPPLLCYNTGRLKDDTLRLVYNKLLPMPDYLICGVGTLIYDVKNGQVIKKFSQILEEGWDLEKITELLNAHPYNLRIQPDHYQNLYKSSWFLDDATDSQVDEIRDLLIKNGLDVNVIYSSAKHLDVLPKWANKGNSLEWLLHHLSIPPENAIVAGNSGNDQAMYNIFGINGIVVGNAQPELMQDTSGKQIFHTNKLYQDAIWEGFNHFGLELKLSEKPLQEEEINLALVNLMETIKITGITSKQQKLIKEGYEQALEVLKKNITPIGFSACSLDDNETIGRDANYRSVWARDGSVVITGTIPLMKKDNEIYDCQRKTLQVLLENTSPAGQVPSNIRIDNQIPDYSGLNGICSIDSGLWLIIAFHDFVKGSGDLDFLRNHIDTITKIMVWLGAHDANSDALLEIPEAGDWMDLKGRNYNILYDEVLWYRANVCIGRLYEILGENRLAGEHITNSQVIKNSIIKFFWPGMHVPDTSLPAFSTRFADTNGMYLLSQITPFGFGWRCDVYGNILAQLYNIVDKPKAINIFRFIWGSGGNEPYPVKNIYPALLTNDPDQRSYYSGNLLNLPDHYHNGGVWPFIGGAWVRSINKIGLREIALKELHKLAKLNRLGIYNKWEFNEWFHGVTGRPMGKAYQSWSASAYIHACHDLGIVK